MLLYKSIYVYMYMCIDICWQLPFFFPFFFYPVFSFLDYFFLLTLFLVDHHAMSEVCHHLTNGEKWDDLTRVLTDLTFVELKSQCEQAYGLLSDYNAATKDDMKYEGKDKVSAFRDFFKRYFFFLFSSFFFFLLFLFSIYNYICHFIIISLSFF